MIKGKMKIELINTKNGEVETIEKDNMITEALQDIFTHQGFYLDSTTMYDTLAPYYEKLLGGILLFDKKLEENPKKYFAPADVNMVGCGAYGMSNNTSNTARGHFNPTESEVNKIDRYVKYVYEFTTAQANGTIASVCLTSQNGGLCGYGHESVVEILNNRFFTNVSNFKLLNSDRLKQNGLNIEINSCYLRGFSNTELAFNYDLPNNAVFTIEIPTSSDINIRARNLYTNGISILEHPANEKALISTPVHITTIGEGALKEYNMVCYDNVSNFLYILSADSGSLMSSSQVNSWAPYRGRDQATIFKVDIVNKTCEAIPFKNDSNYGLNFTNGQNIIYNNYLYTIGTGGPEGMKERIVRINLENTVDISYVGSVYKSFNFLYAKDDNIFMEYGKQTYKLNLNTEEIYMCETKTASNYDRDSLYIKNTKINSPYIVANDYNYGLGLHLINNYLATINNLEEPVVKTAEKTMKITYILQEV